MRLLQAFQQPGGFLMLLDSMRGGNTAATTTVTTSTVNRAAVDYVTQQLQSGNKSSSSSMGNKPSSSKSPRLRDSKQATGDATTAKPLTAQATAVKFDLPFARSSNPNESNNEDSEDYEADYTSEESESLTIVKRKPKKI